MYKVLLVDDEILIRENIAKIIDWESLGLELVKICENGKEAIEILQKKQIDIIITDICMPYVDGLELSQYIYEKQYNSKVMIITGYEDFKYAKKAIEYHVFSYVLKPITKDELIKELKNIVKIISKEEHKEVKKKEIQQYSSEALEVLKESFFKEILEGRITISSIKEKEALFDVNIQNEVFICCAIYWNKENIDEYIKFNIQEKIKFYINDKKFNNLVCFSNASNEIILLFNGKKNSSYDYQIKDICMEIKNDIEEKMNLKIAILQGFAVSNIQKIWKSFDSAKKMKEYLYLENSDDFLDIDIYEKVKQEKNIEPQWAKYTEKLILFIKRNKKEKIEEVLNNIVMECKDRWIKPSIIIMQFQKIVTNIIDELINMNVEKSEVNRLYEEAISNIFDSTTIENTKLIIKNIAFYAADIVSRNEMSNGEIQVNVALEYIIKNFSDVDLSLQSMCEKLNMSISYFSATFKEYTGTTFIERLKVERIENAKKLLSTSKLKTYEIAERCGYSDSSYFRSVFKKEVGMTTREYYKKNYIK